MKELLRYRILRGKIHVETGIHIGAGRESMEIGGVEPPIMRHPLTQQPYIPGSSLKGKVRCLLELKYCVKNEECFPTMKQAEDSWKPCGCGKCPVCIVFGSSNVKTTKTMTRVIFRDAFMTPDSVQKQEEASLEAGGYLSEIKSEIAINRKTLTVQSGALRTTERIVPGTELDLEIVLRHFEGDPVDDYLGLLKEGLDLLQRDSLGGSGSRGYGKVSIRDLTVEESSRNALANPSGD